MTIKAKWQLSVQEKQFCIDFDDILRVMGLFAY